MASGQQLPAGPFASRTDMNARLAAVIHERIVAQQPLRVSADAITLTGDALRLTGHAKVSFDDTAVFADEVVIDRGTSHAEPTGNVRAVLGSAV